MSGLRTEFSGPCNSKSLTGVGRDSSLVKGVEVEKGCGWLGRWRSQCPMG